MTAAGGGGLDIVVANAGGARPGPLLAQSPEDWQDVLTLNLIGTSLTVKHAGLAMRETGGAIVAISSQSAVRPAKYNAMYTVSKAAVDSLVRCAAIELAPFSIRVNGIRPGLVLSEHSSRVAKEPYASLISKTLLGRHGSPEEIGDAVLYLTSEMGGWVTGQVLSVCGGLSVSDCDDMESLLGPQASEKSLTSRVHH
jgi:NAD(P)-dependent dehydrogenase (short-subunit alcohol dehydrogenase family)